MQNAPFLMQNSSFLMQNCILDADGVRVLSQKLIIFNRRIFIFKGRIIEESSFSSEESSFYAKRTRITEVPPHPTPLQAQAIPLRLSETYLVIIKLWWGLLARAAVSYFSSTRSAELRPSSASLASETLSSAAPSKYLHNSSFQIQNSSSIPRF